MGVAFNNTIKIPRIIKREALGLPDAYVVEMKDMWDTYFPWLHHPMAETLMLSGFMDDQGQVHFEFNHSLFKPKEFMTLRSLFNPRRYYQGLLDHFMGTSLLKNEKKLIAGGQCCFHFPTKTMHMMNLVIMPRSQLTGVSEEVRRNAIFLFQKEFESMSRRMGTKVARTSTCVIPDEKMQALGWQPEKIKSFKEWWAFFKEWWPISLRGLQRNYVRVLEDTDI